MRTACAALCVLAFSALAPFAPTLPWCAAQLIKSLWPLDSVVAERLQIWAWEQWEAEVAGRDLPAQEVPELAIGESPPSDRSSPYIVRGLLNGTGSTLLEEGFGWLMRGELGNLEVDYFSNASVESGLIPDARGRLADVVGGIIDGGSAKIGTEMIFRTFPRLLTELRVAERAEPLLGDRSHINESRLGMMLTVPVFMAHGAPRARTDLHCEPIGNLAIQLGGTKRWTLVGPEESHLLRPTLSEDGRAYFRSALPTEHPETSLRHVKRWIVETATGDAIWVPTWTWHRVDYLPGVTALSASLFHFRVGQVLKHNALYSALAVPNIAKELVQWKTQ